MSGDYGLADLGGYLLLFALPTTAPVYLLALRTAPTVLDRARRWRPEGPLLVVAALAFVAGMTFAWMIRELVTYLGSGGV